MAERSRRQVKKSQELQHILFKEKEKNHMKQLRKILRKPFFERTEEEKKILEDAPDLVHHIEAVIEKNKCIKERTKEVIDDAETLLFKCEQLAKALKESSSTVVYTGAGISTSAHIPDYRGPSGIWTLLQKGKEITFKDLSQAEPTYTHMALKQLHKEGYVSHIVSQNCDGLHMRSGIPKSALSELHGNMFVEVCPKCKPLRQYIRLFDVTEHTAIRRHKTGRFCKKCKSELNDTIVHFGEKSKLLWPMNWKGAVKAISKSDVILCLGSSLKVLRRYPCLWATDKPHNKRPKLYIVNLQWTPKDPQSTLKIHGKCDDVMKLVMANLNIDVPPYKKENDPIFELSTPLTKAELSSTTRQLLSKDLEEKFSQAITRSMKSEVSEENCNTDTLQSEDIHSKILSINDSLTVNNENVDWKNHRNDLTMNAQSGWYGKGCAKLKRKKKVGISCKRLKKEET